MEQLQQKAIAQVFADRLAPIGKDIPAWVDLFVEDAIVEFPYASALGSPEGLEGKAAIYNYMKDVPAQMQKQMISAMKLQSFYLMKPGQVNGLAISREPKI